MKATLVDLLPEILTIPELDFAIDYYAAQFPHTIIPRRETLNDAIRSMVVEFYKYPDSERFLYCETGYDLVSRSLVCVRMTLYDEPYGDLYKIFGQILAHQASSDVRSLMAGNAPPSKQHIANYLKSADVLLGGYIYSILVHESTHIIQFLNAAEIYYKLKMLPDSEVYPFRPVELIPNACKFKYLHRVYGKSVKEIGAIVRGAHRNEFYGYTEQDIDGFVEHLINLQPGDTIKLPEPGVK